MLEKDIDKVISSNGFLSKLSIGVVIAIGVWVGTIQSRQLRNISDIATNAIKYESVEQRIQKGDVAEAEIRTKLVGIETTLEEIKVAVKNIR